MGAPLRAKLSTMKKLYEQFKIHGLTTDITYREYQLKVGSIEALHPRVIAKGWRGRWPVVMSALKKQYPDVNEIINSIKEEPAPKPIPKKTTASKPKDSGLEALGKKTSAKKKED